MCIIARRPKPEGPKTEAKRAAFVSAARDPRHSQLCAIRLGPCSFSRIHRHRARSTRQCGARMT